MGNPLLLLDSILGPIAITAHTECILVCNLHPFLTLCPSLRVESPNHTVGRQTICMLVLVQVDTTAVPIDRDAEDGMGLSNRTLRRILPLSCTLAASMSESRMHHGRSRNLQSFEVRFTPNTLRCQSCILSVQLQPPPGNFVMTIPHS